MKLASHDSWSFKSPIKWWMKPFHFVAKCQSKKIKAQYEKYGAKLFDMRLRFEKDKWYVSHGSMLFTEIPYDDLEFLSGKGVMVRVLLEYNKEPKDSSIIEGKFYSICQSLQRQYPLIKFFGGNCKYKWSRIIYDFQNGKPQLIDEYSSMTSWFKSKNKFLRIIDDWIPWLYAKFHNKKNIKKYQNEDKYLFLDFVNIQ